MHLRLSDDCSSLQRGVRHRQSPIIRLVTPNEPRRMTKYAPVDPTDLAQIGITHSPPVLRHGLAVDKRIRAFGDTLDPPSTSWLVAFGVENVQDRRRRWRKGGLEAEEVIFPGRRLDESISSSRGESILAGRR